MPRLSVDLNKIALLRNSRRTSVPDILRFGQIAHDAGADGPMAHSRPDERHIRRTDVLGLAKLGLIFNIGHDLNLDNLPALTAALPAFAEASIGHELTGDALVMGFAPTVRAYKAALGGAGRA